MSVSDHLTKVGGLKPANIVQAAQSDLRNRSRCVEEGEWLGRQYAFLSKHVRRSVTPAELIKRAIEDRDEEGHSPAENSAKRNTRLIYGDLDLLREALSAAETA